MKWKRSYTDIKPEMYCPEPSQIFEKPSNEYYTLYEMRSSYGSYLDFLYAYVTSSI